MRWPWVIAVVGALVGLLTLTACGGDHQPVADASAGPTPISRLDSASMHVIRVAFCDLVPKNAVRRALLAAPTRTRSWRNGDQVPGAGRQAGHEFGCSWVGPHRRTAEAWVFARPVSVRFAGSLVRAARAARCQIGTGGRGFGRSSVIQTCVHAGRPRRIRHAGLFGDTWLTCQVSGTGKAAALRHRADAWCVSVANALDVGAS